MASRKTSVTQYCRDIKYPQIRHVLNRIKPVKERTADGCDIYIFTDTEIRPQSNEPGCLGVTESNRPDCILKEMIASYGCEIKNTYQFGTCNPPGRGAHVGGVAPSGK